MMEEAVFHERMKTHIKLYAIATKLEDVNMDKLWGHYQIAPEQYKFLVHSTTGCPRCPHGKGFQCSVCWP